MQTWCSVFLYRNEQKANHIICSIKLGSDTDWHLSILTAKPTFHLQKICHHPHTDFFLNDEVMKHSENQAGENFKEFPFQWLPICQLSTCWLLVSAKVCELSIYLTVCLSYLAGWLWQENIFSLSRAEFKLQNLLFVNFSHNDLQLSSEFRLCNIIIVSECQTGNLKTVMMR